MPDLILEGSKWKNDVNRREEKERDYCFYNDDHNYSVSNGYKVSYDCTDIDGITNTLHMTADGFLEEIIFKRVNFQEAAILKEYIETDNLTKSIIDAKSILFKVQPSITIEASEERQEKFNQFLEDTNFFPLLRQIQRLTELQFDLHVIPQIRDGKVCIDIVLAQDAFVEQDKNDPTKFTKFFYQTGVLENTVSSEKVTEYIYWDADGQHKCEITADGQIDQATVEDIPSVWDGTKVIPVVVFRNYIPINTYWSPRKNYLVEKNIQVDLRLTALNMLEDFNLPQKVRIGMDADVEGKVGLTFTEDILRNDQGEAVGSVNYIRPDAPVTEEKELIEWRKKEVAVSSGLSADSLTGKTFTSGFELFLSKSEIIEKNKEDRPLYRQPLKQLLSYMMFLAKDKANYGATVDTMPEVSINFGELVYTQSPEEVERVNAAKLVNGTGSLVEFAMKEDPDLDEEEAIKLIKQRQSWKKLTAPTDPFKNEKEND